MESSYVEMHFIFQQQKIDNPAWDNLRELTSPFATFLAPSRPWRNIRRVSVRATAGQRGRLPRMGVSDAESYGGARQISRIY